MQTTLTKRGRKALWLAVQITLGVGLVVSIVIYLICVWIGNIVHAHATPPVSAITSSAQPAAPKPPLETPPTTQEAPTSEPVTITTAPPATPPPVTKDSAESTQPVHEEVIPQNNQSSISVSISAPKSPTTVVSVSIGAPPTAEPTEVVVTAPSQPATVQPTEGNDTRAEDPPAADSTLRHPQQSTSTDQDSAAKPADTPRDSGLRPYPTQGAQRPTNSTGAQRDSGQRPYPTQGARRPANSSGARQPQGSRSGTGQRPYPNR